MKIFIAAYGLFMTFVLSTVFQKTRQQSIADGAEIYQDFCAHETFQNAILYYVYFH